MNDEQWPPNHGIPAKTRYKKAKSLRWGETPFDDLTRGELLRLVQAYHAAAVGANSVIYQVSYGQDNHPYWSKDGRGGRAKARLEYLITRAGDGGADAGSENIYRKFFRSAYGLLFPGIKDEYYSWGIDDVSGEMVAPYKPGETSPFDGKRKLRAIKWRDLLPTKKET